MQRMLRVALLTATCAWLGSAATMRLEPEMGWDLGDHRNGTALMYIPQVA